MLGIPNYFSKTSTSFAATISPDYRPQIMARKNRWLWGPIMACVVAWMAVPIIHAASATTIPVVLPPHASPAQLAAQLEKTHAVARIAAALKAATTPADKALFGAADIFCRWDQFKNHPAQQQQMKERFIRDVNIYLKSADNNVDPGWSTMQAQFVLASLTTNTVNEIEFWSGTPALRRELAPAANLARRLLQAAQKHYSQVIKNLNNASTFTDADEQLYTLAMNGQRDTAYYLAYADYFSGLALPPGDKMRQTLLGSAISGISPYAKVQNSGVYYRALLLRGKAYLHNGQYNKALHDLTTAASSHAPVWLQYDAYYQQVTALLRSGRYDQARAKLKSFMTWTAKQVGANSISAKMGEQLLAFRIAEASANALKNPAQRASAQAAAIAMVSNVIRQAPQYQRLIFTHLAQHLPAKIDPATLQPLQVLAAAWLEAQNPATTSQRQALAIAQSLLARKELPPSIRSETTLIAAITAAQLGQLDLAAKMNIAFVRLSPTDPRARHVMALALSELAQLNESRQVSADITKLTTAAISLDWHTFHDPQIRFPYALQLENAGQYKPAIKLFNEIPAADPLYLDAQYQLVRIGAEQLSALTLKKAPETQQHQAARQLLQTADKYLHLLDHPPAAIAPAALARARRYRVNILLLEAGTAINPLRNPYRAGQILDKLTVLEKQLSPKLRGILLRYRIRQYQLAGENNKILPLVRKFAGESTQKSTDVIKGLIGQYDQESRKIRHTDPGKARRLAAGAAALLQQLIQSLQSQPGRKNQDDIYAYQQIRAAELIRAGEGQVAWQEYKALEKQRPGDLTNFIGAARALYAAGNFDHAHSIYVRLIPQLEPGSAIYWQAYYYLIRCNVKSNAYASQTRAALKQLVALYGKQIGGKEYHRQFELLLQEFNLTD
ncbi:MAG: hypothetical protein ACP5I8_01035 [Phycisphaerae bacterium]